MFFKFIRLCFNFQFGSFLFETKLIKKKAKANPRPGNQSHALQLAGEALENAGNQVYLMQLQEDGIWANVRVQGLVQLPGAATAMLGKGGRGAGLAGGNIGCVPTEVPTDMRWYDAAAVCPRTKTEPKPHRRQGIPDRSAPLLF